MSVFDDFWTASAVTPVNQPGFVQQVSDYRPAEPAPYLWAQPGTPVPLPRASGPGPQRRSERRFGPAPLTLAEVGGLLAALTRVGGHRRYAAAGGLYAVGASICCWRAAEPLGGRTWQHHAERHDLTDVGPCPDWEQERRSFAVDPTADQPAAAVLLFAGLAAARAKYGLRADRFVLMEAGAALQELGLAAARLGLAGYAIGGSIDARMRALCRLQRTSAQYLTTYLVGHPVG